MSDTRASIPRRRLDRLYRCLLQTHGPQGWWPSNGGPFEIMVGAVLTQNTAWINVEKALQRLHRADAMEAERMLDLPRVELADLIRPSGYFNIKADRLQQMCRWYRDAGGYRALKEQKTDDLRRSLLQVRGIGPETADDILLYAFDRPVFVVDAYTFRLFERFGLIDPGYRYEQLRAGVEQAVGSDTHYFNELHALVVRHCSQVCRPKPDCDNCALHRDCAFING